MDDFPNMTSRIYKLITILQNPFYRQALLRYRVAAAVEHAALLNKIGRELKTVVDIGANRGQFALATRHHAQEAYIIAFEPLQEAAEVFAKVFQADPGVELHRCAIGSKQGEVVMHVSRADDSSSLLPISDLQQQLFPGTQEKGTRQVTVTPLDLALFPAQIQAPALLKIDVQGYELEVLKGSSVLLGCFDFLLVECSYKELYTGQALADEVVSFVERAGFVLLERGNLVCDQHEEPIQADFFFKRK